MCGVFVFLGSIVVLMLMCMVQTDSDQDLYMPGQSAPRLAYQQIPQPLDRQNRKPWSGQQHVHSSQCKAMWDVENDAAHSGFQSNRPYKAPKFVAGLTAMSNDII
jgi:hypothetical protein